MDRHDRNATDAPDRHASMVGYGVKIRALRQDDVDRWSIDLAGHPLNECIAVDGEDLGACLAAVVHPAGPTLLWSDADGAGAPIPNPSTFAAALLTVVRAVHAHGGAV